jgi:tetratricopeptide (TPR) repeat protein
MKAFLWYSLILYLSFCTSGLFGQTGKGGKPLSSLTPHSSSLTRAVVIGISDYQDERIPDLRFADRDAEAFAAWLASPAGGNVPADNIQVFTNEKATNAAVITALYALIDACQPGDQVVFYFSGHGDVETKTRNQPGFLLTYDTPPNVYMAGALNLRDLQEIVSTLAEMQVRMVLVTDACHAGKLAGSGIGGTQATSASLQRQFANEVKIMSCQPNEFSLEGEQWGGGRGVFSYHLVDALTGLADKNSDGMVSLLEVGRYLEEIVPAETAPHPQLPVVSGDRMASLARVDAASLAALQKSRTGTSLASTDTKGLEDEVMAKASSLTQKHYEDFKKALAAHNLLEENDSSAEAHFQNLIAQEVLAPLHGLMRRNYAVALLDEVQQALNALLESDPYETNNWLYNPDKYIRYPDYIQRAIELLGNDKHPLYRSLMAKKLYFEAYNLYSNLDNKADKELLDSTRTEAKRLLLQAVAFDSEAAYLYFSIGNLYSQNNPNCTDSLTHYFQMALERSPNWLLPYLEASYEWNVHGNLDESERWLLKALDINPESYVTLERLSWLRQWQGRPEESAEISLKMIALKPDLFNAYSTLGNTLAFLLRDYEQAEKYSKKGLELSPYTSNWAHVDLVYVAIRTREHEKAYAQGELLMNADTFPLLRKGTISFYLMEGSMKGRNFQAAEKYIDWIEKKNLWVGIVALARSYRGIIQFMAGNHAEARRLLEESMTIDPTPNLVSFSSKVCLANIAAKENKPAEAERLYREAFAWEHLEQMDARSRLPVLEEGHFYYGYFLLAQNRLTEALAQFQSAHQAMPRSYLGEYGLAVYHARLGDKVKALDHLEQALDWYFPNSETILEEPLFKKIRKTKRFKALMEKHFPERTKH